MLLKIVVIQISNFSILLPPYNKRISPDGYEKEGNGDRSKCKGEEKYNEDRGSTKW